MTFPQARVRDPISHADISGFEVGSVVGIVVGAVVVVAIVGSGGTLGVVGAIGITAAGGSAGVTLGELIVDQNTQLRVEGHIDRGSPDTFIGVARQPAARAIASDPKTTVDCHPGEYVISGSRSVFINRGFASRRWDGTSCGGFITDGDPTVLTGDESAALMQFEERPVDANLLFRHYAGLALEVAGVVASPSTALEAIEMGVNAAGAGVTAITGPIHSEVTGLVPSWAPGTGPSTLQNGLSAAGTGLGAINTGVDLLR